MPPLLAGFLTVLMGLVGATTVFSVITVVLSLVGLGYAKRY